MLLNFINSSELPLFLKLSNSNQIIIFEFSIIHNILIFSAEIQVVLQINVVDKTYHQSTR